MCSFSEKDLGLIVKVEASAVILTAHTTGHLELTGNRVGENSCL